MSGNQTKLLYVVFAAFMTLVLVYVIRRGDDDVTKLNLAINERQRCLPEAAITKLEETTATPLGVLPQLLGRDMVKFKVMYLGSRLAVYLYAALLDDRVTPHVTRVFGVQHRNLNLTHFWCRHVYPDEATGATWSARVTWEFVDSSWPDWSPYFAVHIECPLAHDAGSRRPDGAPEAVELRFGDGQSTEIVRLPVETAVVASVRSPLAVVVKPITGEFHVSRVVEWLEIQRLVSVQTFILYNTDLAGPSRYVMDYYRQLGVVHTVSFPYLTAVLEKVEEVKLLTPEQRYAVYQQVYLVALQDALYRFRKVFKYLAIIDLDEVILPTRQMALESVVAQLANDYANGAGFTFPTAWHFEDTAPETSPDRPEAPPYLYMQRYVRASAPNHIQPKSIVMTSRARTVNFHAIVTSLGDGYAREVEVDWRTYGYVHHYRGQCRNKFDDEICQNIITNSTVDRVVSRYLGELQPRVLRVIEHLQLR